MLRRPLERAEGQPPQPAEAARSPTPEQPPTAEEAWELVRDELKAARSEWIQARARMVAAMDAFDAFKVDYPLEAARLTGDYRRKVADERAALDAYRAEHARLAEVHAEERVEEALRIQLDAIQREATAKMQRVLRQREGGRRLSSGGSQEEELLANLPARAGAPPRRRWCPVCGRDGVDRGRECPNRGEHPAILAAKPLRRR